MTYIPVWVTLEVPYIKSKKIYQDKHDQVHINTCQAGSILYLNTKKMYTGRYHLETNPSQHGQL